MAMRQSPLDVRAWTLEDFLRFREAFWAVAPVLFRNRSPSEESTRCPTTPTDSDMPPLVDDEPPTRTLSLHRMLPRLRSTCYDSDLYWDLEETATQITSVTSAAAHVASAKAPNSRPFKRRSQLSSGQYLVFIVYSSSSPSSLNRGRVHPDEPSTVAGTKLLI